MKKVSLIYNTADCSKLIDIFTSDVEKLGQLLVLFIALDCNKRWTLSWKMHVDTYYIHITKEHLFNM